MDTQLSLRDSSSRSGEVSNHTLMENSEYINVQKVFPWEHGVYEHHMMHKRLESLVYGGSSLGNATLW